MATIPHNHGSAARNTPVTVGICVFLAIAAILLSLEHRAHVLGILPYLLLAACPLIHMLMHGRHGGDQGHAHHTRDDEGGRS